MKEFYKILFIDKNDCFFYLNEGNLRKLKKYNGMESFAIEIEFGENFSRRTYSSLNRSCMKNIGDDEIGVNFYYASLQGLKEKDLILVSICVAPSLRTVYVRTEQELHRALIEENFNHLQFNILNQVNTVCKGQTIPIYILNNIIILLKIEKTDPFKLFGKLEKCSELVVLNPSDNCDVDEKFKNISESDNCPNEGIIINRHDADFTDYLSPEFNLSYGDDMQQNDKKDLAEDHQLKKFFKNVVSFVFQLGGSIKQTDEGIIDQNASETYKGFELMKEYKVGSFFSVENKIPDEIKDKFIFAWNIPFAKPVFGPCSFKVFCKISKTEENSNQKDVLKYKHIKESNCNHLYSYVVGFINEKTKHFSNELHCPNFVMEALHLKVGSVVKIEKTKWTNEMIRSNGCSYVPSVSNRIQKKEGILFFPDETNKIYESIIRTVIDNIKYKERINVLIVGDPGCGKTFTLNALSDFFKRKFLHCSRIDCKSLHRMNVENLKKLLNEKSSECCRFSPSIMLFDDLDSLFDEDDEGFPYSSIYSQRIGDLLISTIFEVQKVHQVTVIAAANSVSKLGYISTARGPIVFESIHEMGELNSKARHSILTELIRKRNGAKDVSLADEVSEKTRGYNIQDLCDLVEVAALKSLERMDSSPDESADIVKSDFEAALSGKTPLSLSGISLHKGTTTWEDVGGMEEAKRALTELFVWPLKYQDIFSSCPLRNQCGVLLYGAPGTGKTLIAGAVAREFGLNFISIKGPEIFSKYVGASEEGIRNLFGRARQARPCILFFDEFDSLAPRRGDDNTGVNDRVVNQMLTELDGFEELRGVFVLAATSRPDLLDPALLRPGRIDKAVHCALPEMTERLAILKALSRRLNICEDVSLEEVARRSEGFTGADLQAMLCTAQTFLVKEMEKDEGAKEGRTDFRLKEHHLLAGLAETKPSVSKKDKLKYRMIYEGFGSSKMGGWNKSEDFANKQRQQQMKLTFA